jgi:hypothetical protein
MANNTRIKLHNPELSANSKLYNLVLEDKGATISDAKAGRIWFNTADQAVEFGLGGTSGAKQLATTTGVEARLGITATREDGTTLQTVADQLALKANLASPTFTGTVTTSELAVTGNLTVSGTTTFVNTQDLQVEDSLITLNKIGDSSTTGGEYANISLVGSGIEVAYASGTEGNYTTDTAKLIVWRADGVAVGVNENGTYSTDKVVTQRDIGTLPTKQIGQDVVSMTVAEAIAAAKTTASNATDDKIGDLKDATDTVSETITVAGAIEVEKNARVAAIGTIPNRKNADGTDAGVVMTVAEAIEDAKTTASNAGGKIGDLKDAAGNTDTALTVAEAIAVEKNARVAAIGTLPTKNTMDGDVSMTVAEAIDAAVKQSKAKYVAAEIPATTFNNTQYVINHNLNTTFVDVSVQVKTGGIWTFDLVVVQVDSANAVTVTLASPAEGIRYVVHGYDAGDYIAVTPTTHTQPAPNDLGQ